MPSGPSGVSVVVHACPECCVLVVEGELDIGGVGTLSAQTSRALGSTSGTVVLDLSGVSFIDAAGVGALVAIRTSAAAAHRPVRLREPSAPVRRLLRLTELDAQFAVQDNNGRPHG
jgi:anti-sigma B factor antagonist